MPTLFKSSLRTPQAALRHPRTGDGSPGGVGARRACAHAKRNEMKKMKQAADELQAILNTRSDDDSECVAN